jgi:hypothetical protein
VFEYFTSPAKELSEATRPRTIAKDFMRNSCWLNYF